MVENLTIITSRVPYVNIFNHIPAQLLPVLLALGISLAPALYARMQLRGREGSTSVTIKPNVSQTSEPKTNSTRTWQKTWNHATHKTSITILYLGHHSPPPRSLPCTSRVLIQTFHPPKQWLTGRIKRKVTNIKCTLKNTQNVSSGKKRTHRHGPKSKQFESSTRTKDKLTAL